MRVDPLVPSAPLGRDSRPVTIGKVVFGGSGVPVIAGPCSVEPGYLDHARAAAAAGASALRGCVFKPRTKPNTFQGLGAEGIDLLDQARAEIGLPIVAEPLSEDHIKVLLGHVDALQIGARSMQNTPLLRAAGATGLPVILKRGLSATIDEWLGAADYILETGNSDIVLCERGIRTFETATRGTLDISAVAVLRERTSLPVIVDPSHAAGRSDWVAPLAIAAVAVGADGLLIEAHPAPSESWSDADQAVTPAVLADIIGAIRLLAPSVRPTSVDTLPDCRSAIDAVDVALGRILQHRAELVAAVYELKQTEHRPVRDTGREKEVVEHVSAVAPRLPADSVERIMRTVIDACVDAAAGAAASNPEAVAG